MRDSEFPSQSSVTKIGFHLSMAEKLSMLSEAYVPGMQHIVEIGPGRGYVCKWAKELGLKYTAIDQSDVSRHMILDMGADNFIVAAAPDIPHVPADMYVLMNILEHMSTPHEADTLMSRIYHNLKPGGRILIQVPDVRFYNDFYGLTAEHNYPTSLLRSCTLLEKHNFNVVYKGLWCGPLFLPLGYVLFWPSIILHKLLLLLSPTKYTMWHKIPKFITSAAVGEKENDL